MSRRPLRSFHSTRRLIDVAHKAALAAKDTEWSFGLLSDTRLNLDGLSVRRVGSRDGRIEVWWHREASADLIASKLRELADKLEAS